MKSDSLLKKAGSHGYILPALLVFVVFLFYSFFKTIYLSLCKTNRMGQAKLLAGLGNYVGLLKSASFYNSLVVAFLFMTIVVVGSMALELLATVLYNKVFPGIRISSTAHVLPMAIASSSVAMIFKIMLHPLIGIMNKLLGLSTNWIDVPKYALVCAALLTARLNSEINFLYFGAGLNNIDDTTRGRVSADGANRIQKSLRLTLPGLSPIMFYTTVVNTIQTSQPFGQAKILIQGGPGELTNLTVCSIYRDASFSYRLDNVMTQSIILFAIIIVMAPLMSKAEKEGVSY